MDFWEKLDYARRKLRAADKVHSIRRQIVEWTEQRDRDQALDRFDYAASASEFLSEAHFRLEMPEPSAWNRCFAAAYWIKAGRPEDALRVLKETRVRLDSGSEAEIRARAHRALGQPECALAALSRAKTAKLLELRGEVYRDLGADEECVRDYAAALHLRVQSGEKDLDVPILRLLEIADQLCRRKEAVDLIRHHYEAWMAGLLRRRPRR